MLMTFAPLSAAYRMPAATSKKKGTRAATGQKTARSPGRHIQPDQGLELRAGEGNRTLTVSLGIAQPAPRTHAPPAGDCTHWPGAPSCCLTQWHANGTHRRSRK